MYKIILINPGIHINTGWAFSNIIPSPVKKSVKEIIQQPIETWKAELQNDFEAPVFVAHPEIKNIKDSLYQQGAIYAAMSGSGSTLFGIFNKTIDTTPFKDRNYFTKIIN
jgi:4-diphosphocytidyl-2-C-methyl-D-erythritol kinase